MLSSRADSKGEYNANINENTYMIAGDMDEWQGRSIMLGRRLIGVSAVLLTCLYVLMFEVLATLSSAATRYIFYRHGIARLWQRGGAGRWHGLAPRHRTTVVVAVRETATGRCCDAQAVCTSL
ncbi:hypothetical protein [Janthinobacterium sp. HLX7-2]|uniref:hypothetical protein n=1 Tax=Janthinobacterium sp. HLX7-2 TaxID=1259331 RepID=UPI003F2987E7